MDRILQKLIPLSEQFRKLKIEFFEYSDIINSSFNLPKDQISYISFGIIKSSKPALQKYVDALNEDSHLNKLNNELLNIKLCGIISILEYASKCCVEISGYDLTFLLKNPIKNYNEISNLFEGLAGVNHIHIVDGKIMLEIPARKYVTKNRRLLKYVDFWAKELEKFS